MINSRQWRSVEHSVMNYSLFKYPMNNNITIRQNGLYEGMSPVMTSDTSVEAAMKTRRLFKKICRVVT